MKNKILLSILFTVLLLPVLLSGQDQIHLRSNEIINCKVKEIGMDEVKYTLPDYPQDVLFSIDKELVLKIIFSDGKVMNFYKEMTNPANYTDNKKNAVKIDFLSPLTGNTTLAYEHSLKPGQSIEGTLCVIGAGQDVKDSNPFGIMASFGMKFIKSPDFYMRGMRYAHVLKGGYVKPEFILGHYNENETVYDYSNYPQKTKTVKKDVTTGALILNIGKQWVYNNAFLVDFNVGVGYGFDNLDSGSEYHYAFAITGENGPLSFKAGLKIGFLF